MSLRGADSLGIIAGNSQTCLGFYIPCNLWWTSVYTQGFEKMPQVTPQLCDSLLLWQCEKRAATEIYSYRGLRGGPTPNLAVASTLGPEYGHGGGENQVYIYLMIRGTTSCIAAPSHIETQILVCWVLAFLHSEFQWEEYSKLKVRFNKIKQQEKNTLCIFCVCFNQFITANMRCFSCDHYTGSHPPSCLPRFLACRDFAPCRDDPAALKQQLNHHHDRQVTLVNWHHLHFSLINTL